MFCWLFLLSADKDTPESLLSEPHIQLVIHSGPLEGISGQKHTYQPWHGRHHFFPVLLLSTT